MNLREYKTYATFNNKQVKKKLICSFHIDKKSSTVQKCEGTIEKQPKNGNRSSSKRSFDSYCSQLFVKDAIIGCKIIVHFYFQIFKKPTFHAFEIIKK